MIVLKKSNLRPFDVDETLVLHTDKRVAVCAQYVPLINIINPYDNKIYQYQVHENMVKLLKEEHARGNPVIVWSRRGWQWAEAVVLALGLQDIVQLVLEKPTIYFDDRDVSEWMRDRVYIGPNEPFK